MSKSTEDFLEAVYLGVENISDLAAYLNIKKPSVTEKAKSLAKEGYLIYRRYSKLKLTMKGRNLAKKIYFKHSSLIDFLRKIGVDNELSETEACLIEHYLSYDTVKKIKRASDNIGPRKSEERRA
ncbi:MAG: metal-dependent transcriptional regulator [Nanobdellota archaeon]